MLQLHIPKRIWKQYSLQNWGFIRPKECIVASQAGVLRGVVFPSLPQEGEKYIHTYFIDFPKGHFKDNNAYVGD